MNGSLTAFPSLLAALMCTTSAFGDTWHVPGDFGTIQAAIDAAVDGDTVLVADGTYTGKGNRDLDFGGRAITLQSANGAATCIIDVQADSRDPHRAFHFHNGEGAASVVEGFTIQNGFMSRGGAVLCEAGSAPLFQSCVFTQNNVSQAVEEDGGGAVYAMGSSPTFIDCEFLQNQAEATFVFGGGGAVKSQSGSSPTFIRCAFSENSAFGVEADGGAVTVLDGGHPEFYSCTFTANEAVWDAAVSNSSGVTMHDCHFLGNTTTGSAGGAYGQYGGNFGGGSSEFLNCSFVGNTSLGSGGGAVVVQFADAVATFTNCLFAHNAALGGGGNGGAVWAGDEAEFTAINCTFSGNTASDGGGALRAKTFPVVDLVNCVLWNNAPFEISVQNAEPAVSHCNVEDGWPGTGNIDENPLFIDANGPDDDPDTWEDNDYRLSSGSPCVDAADNTAVPEDVATDLDDNPRFVDDPDTPDTGNPDDVNSQVDMGAYEFCRADTNRDGTVDVQDLVNVILAWDSDDINADTNADGIVDVVDLVAVITNWGQCS